MHETICAHCDGPPLVTDVAGATLATWPRRVGASLVDWFVLYLVLLVCTVAADYVISVSIFSAAAAYYLISLLATERGQTVGCIAANTRVRSVTTGGRATINQTTRRFIGSAVPLLVTMLVFQPVVEFVLWSYLVVDALFPLWDRRSQTLHDKWAGTVVVMAPRSGDLDADDSDG